MVTKSGSKSKSATFSEAAAMVVRRACFANFDTSYHIQHSAGWDRYGWMCFFRSICSSLQDVVFGLFSRLRPPRHPALQ